MGEAMESIEYFHDIRKVERISWFTLALPIFNTGALLSWSLAVWVQLGYCTSFNDIDMNATWLGVPAECLYLITMLLPFLFFFIFPFAACLLAFAGRQRKALKTRLRNLFCILLLDAFYFWFIFA